MKNRKLMAVLGLTMVALMLFGSVSIAGAHPKPKPRFKPQPHLVTRAINQAQYHATGSLVKNLASLAGTSTAAITAKRCEGSSLTSIAVSFSVEPTAVVDMTLAKFKARLAVLVAKGHVSQAKADAFYAKQEARLWRLMNRVPEPKVPCPVPPCPINPTTPGPPPWASGPKQ